MSLFLYNTLTRRKEVFTPADPARVTMYVCGPTVYSYAHIGNARPAVVFDVLYRLLRRRYPQVVYARNVTDIDDKINAAATAQKVAINDITTKFTGIYRADMAALGVLPPTIEPFATDHVPQIIAMIQALLAKNHAYVAEGHVLFHVPSYAAYGRLSGRDRDDMIAGARVEVAPYKKDPADFVLWKPSTPDLPGWDSPWGRGRPGWHIECSSMIETHLGNTIDIHGGGHDLIFPHHENEIAQGTCAHDGAAYCRVWMHNGFLTMDREKMSKSLGNIALVHDILQSAPGEAIRWALLTAHYRQPLDWSDDLVTQSKRTLDGLYRTLEAADPTADRSASPPEAVIAALDDDLNTPIAMAELAGLAKAINQSSDAAERKRLAADLKAGGEMLGVLQQSPAVWFTTVSAGKTIDAATVESLIAARAAARKARDFAEADRLRQQLAELGVTIEDRAGGTTWRVAG
ncbi:MAG: cysteine--tRNA ligase [Rhodospirillaceae bacterium]|nr:MAG: cysteine--tRNA ligase [Rhodospirillaceae bacterium]